MCQSCSNGGQPQAATYSRVSTEDQGERGTSLETQAAACLSLLTGKGYTVPPEYRILEEFSGATLERTGLKLLRQLVRGGLVDAIAYYTADRLSRDSVDLMILLREFHRSGVEVVAVRNPPSDDPLGRAITFMQGTFSELERREIAERTMRGKREVASRGQLPQGTGAGFFGYDYDPTTKTRKTNVSQAQVVKRIFIMVAQGHSLHGIATTLNREGHKTLTGKLWHPLTIK